MPFAPRDNLDLEAAYNLLGITHRTRADIGPRTAYFLVYMLRNRGRLITNAMWESESMATFGFRPRDPDFPGQIMGSFIKRLRPVIKARGLPLEIVTVRGLGYRLDAPADFKWPTHGEDWTVPSKSNRGV